MTDEELKKKFPSCVHRGSWNPDIEKGEPMFLFDSVMVRDGKAYRIKPGEVWEHMVWMGDGLGVHDWRDPPAFNIQSIEVASNEV